MKKNENQELKQANLIDKKAFGNNFKLIFKNKESKEYYLVLHEWQKKVYQGLEIGKDYLYQWRQGFKNYSFITYLELAKETKKIRVETAVQQSVDRKDKIEIKNSFIQQVIKDLKLRDTTEKGLEQKLEKLKTEVSQITSNNHSAWLFDWIEEVLTVLWIKSRQLPSENTQTEIQERIDKLITNLSALFLSDYLYDDDCDWVKRKNVFCPSCCKKQTDYLKEKAIKEK